MRHRVAGKKLSRDMDHRKALRRNLLVALFTHEEIITTQAKAQAIRGEAEKIITKAKRALAKEDPTRAVHARRIVLAKLGNNRDAMTKVFNVYAPRFSERPGGYTRRYKIGNRKGDNAPMVMLQLLSEDEGAPK